MRQEVTLVTVSDDFDLSPGLAISGTYTDFDRFMADREGMLITHDILEHLNGPECIGSVLDEFQALGAVYYVRGQDPDLMNPNRRRIYQPVSKTLANDLIGLIEDYLQGGDAVVHHPRPASLSSYEEEDFDEFLAECIEFTSQDKSHDLDAETKAEFLKDAADHMRSGFYHAHAVYGCRGVAQNRFYYLREEMIRILKFEVETEGQTFKVLLNDDDSYTVTNTTYENDEEDPDESLPN